VIARTAAIADALGPIVVAGALLAGCATVSLDAPTASTSASDPLPEPTACPADLPPQTRCWAGRDALGAWIRIAIPKDWNGVAVIHAHGGPELGAPRAARVLEDLERWKIMVKAGYLWAGTTYRQGGVAVLSAADDLQRLRRIVERVAGKPRRVIAHGNSWGASVAARAAEQPARWDGVLLSSGVLGGGSRSYDFRLDLRVVYEALCRNHPAPEEPPYPLWQGLPPGATLTRAQLAQRVDTCTGVRHRAAERTPEQQRRLDAILRVIRIRESSLESHLSWATFEFRDIAFQRLGGGNAFANEGVRYVGSDDDEALNGAVARYRRDPSAAAAFAADSDPTGRIDVPVLTLHAIDDPTAFVELESTFNDTMTSAGRADRLVQAYTDEHTHSYLADPEYVAAMAALLDWIDHRDKPTPASIAARCRAAEPAFGPGCALRADYRPEPLANRVPPR
jgi:alpha-beta hydrolase superfamily lysophospholipase